MVVASTVFFKKCRFRRKEGHFEIEEESLTRLLNK